MLFDCANQYCTEFIQLHEFSRIDIDSVNGAGGVPVTVDEACRMTIYC